MPSVRQAEIRALTKQLYVSWSCMSDPGGYGNCYEAARTMIGFCDEQEARQNAEEAERPRNLRGKCDACPEIKIDADCTLENCPEQEHQP